ncbi:MAG: uroporphyrinogen III synthase [Gallionellales bacterium RIFCSPLOWO2_12_FULL_59_22]|nr:MAG: uroporphyrinogen III synthase [Gallionellales bacterium RIFCSPLOWO2_02_FULL_59_110]OGT12085.1 MAG: uroporphyrinogen III synthase [Gallionellales bacterium RIFCSPLOWO2_12_FULL_59_22]
MADFPLVGLKIAVTRPRDQAAPLARRIEEAGGIPLLFPLLDIAPATDQAALREQISRLAQFDLAIFISPNAVHYGMAAIRASGELPQNLKIATVGQGSAKALRELGLAGVIAPTERFDSEGLLALPELQDVAGWRVLILRGDGGRELLGDTLRARGATVEYAACYRRSKPQQDIAALLKAAPDALTVTSSEALAYLWQMLDDAQRESLCGIPLFVPHQRIAELARRQGWRQVLLTDAGDDGLLSALIAWNPEGRKQNERTDSASG